MAGKKDDGLRKRMRRLVERWRSSGEASGAFARRHGLSRFRFQYWRAQFGQVRHHTPKARAASAAAFAPVRVVNDEKLDEGPGSALEIRLAGGDVIRAGRDLPLAQLTAVVRVLRERC